ncbi:sodium-potassium-chloride cotransporter, putative [Pediculus humanus corporis]|uniref:Sodium-potassium-chloride cotransporter, putative n=1 Tax=Pediculus humanus subsp. corporis TaxID=121224 RepID=E0VSF3_PEDHC|nr:sodium-potassium-chloride cotransporter, putative [Pediculus humanus corporis]EEB16309.1 sodium-potassium-chloride cotransporter, putative [Pediculus humanus corporis]
MESEGNQRTPNRPYNENRFTVRRISSVAVMQNVPENTELQVDSCPNAYVNQGYLSEIPYNADRKKSFQHNTLEALPRLDNYRNDFIGLKRPSLGELHGEEKDLKDKNENVAPPKNEPTGHGVKLGWIQGVLIPCLLNIWGVMLFLRLSWVVAQSGISGSLIIIVLSAIVCVLTTTSMSAISTNGEVQGGGIYYIISRSLGPEFGASVGIVFAFANAVAASMNTIGFCSSLNDLLRENDLKILDGGVNDIRIVGTIALLIMVIICAVGMEWESKAQNFLVVIIIAAMLDFVVGAIIGPVTDEEKAKGFEGISSKLLAENWGSDYRYSEMKQQNFFSVFAIFFPSVTGIQAGANISGDLKNPAFSIPNGTMLAVVISMISYAIFVFVAGASTSRDASGIVSELATGQFTNCFNRTCEFGLHNSYTVMQMVSSWGPLIFAGCFAATLSTALTNLLSVPRLIQAIGNDRIYPRIIYFSKGYGKNNEAYRGYVLTFIVSLAFLLIAELNAIAPLISNFYLASYAMINFCTFHAALIKPLGWRPTYKYYNMWLSLVGFILCVGIMFLIDWVTSLITMIITFALYLIVVYRKPDVNWGSSTQAQTYKTALSSALRLVNVSEHVKNYKPQILVLSGKPCARPSLLDLAYLITKNNALFMCADILQKKLSYKARQNRIRESYAWLGHRKIKGFYALIDDVNFEDGVKSLLQAVGVGKLRPNVLMMGFKDDWITCSYENLLSYFNGLHEAFYHRVAVTIVRVPGGLDYSWVTDEEISKIPANGNLTVTSNGTSDRSAALECLPVESPHLPRKFIINEKITKSPRLMLKKKEPTSQTKEEFQLNQTGKRLSQNIMQAMSLFNSKQDKGTIDVWWLYDDGGLTILLPYIISTRHDWSSCKLRVFALANRKQELELETRNMASLLAKFRIDYASLTMVEDITEKPKEETQQLFNKILRDYAGKTEEESEESVKNTVLLDLELEALREKTNRHLRLREFLIQHSSEAKLIVMSLPMPRKSMVSAPLYMAWLEIISRDMPPMMLVRGNQTSSLITLSK